jgi:zinc D-Ala-D-Ala carboxypeptidase
VNAKKPVDQGVVSVPSFETKLESLWHSDTAHARGIDNRPPVGLLPNLRRLAAGLDSVQAALGALVTVSSGYRCPELNRAVGGTPGSQHQQGLAADIVCPAFGEPAAVALAICNSAVAFDQLILEFGRWIHVSFSATPRRETLTIYSSVDGYLEGIVTASGQRLA